MVNTWYWIIGIVIVVIAIYLIWGRKKKDKK
ncbi:MAG: LPXTG cell wall anchor domain-containing protein [Atribacterota bacterium]|nr:LPXTG cell wall anchor domain-containing protein [Atribacterota bacterium]